MEQDLPDTALAELRRISANYPCEVDRASFGVLWERRLVMAGPKDTHITARGRALVLSLEEPETR